MELLELLNPWWKVKKISRELSPRYRRKTLPEIKNLLKFRQIIIVSGIRRVGKSTLMYQLIEDMLKEVNSENIIYFSFDEKVETLLDILEKYFDLTGVDWKKEKCFIFLDEIQKLEDWSNKIKIIYDAFPNLKIIVSGSASFNLEKEAKSNLVGRHFIINVEPLSFAEYLELKGSKIDLEKTKLWESEIKREFKDYLFKPFPEIVNFKEPSLIKRYIKDSIIDRVIKIDLSKKFTHINEDLLLRLIDIFYENPGMYINYDEIVKDLKISKKTLVQHLYYLEFAYLIRRVKNFRPSARITSRKLQRIYPFHFALMFGWTGKTDFETITATKLDAKYYWRKDKKEVDFLLVNKKILPFEVKESVKVRKSDIRWLIFFVKKFNTKKGILIYNGKEEEIEIDGVLIEKIPLWKLFLKNSPALL